MPVILTNSIGHEAKTVPYPSLMNRHRTNRGFVDLRGRPELAANVAEAANSPALKNLLVRIASDSGPIFTVGCDLGARTDLDQEPHLRKTAGGYIDFVCKWFWVGPERWANLWNKVSEKLTETVGDDHWEVHFELRPLLLSLPDLHQKTCEVRVSFHTYAKSRAIALASRERLLAAIDGGLSEAAVETAFHD